MPFTPSHAVVALPFVRTPLVPAAVAIGAMTPDLPLFVRGAGLSYAFTHQAVNILWTALIAFALLLVWRVVLRPAFVSLAPDALAARLPEEWLTTGRTAVLGLVVPRRRPGDPLLLATSLLIGVASHIAWDLFTHEGRWGVDAVPLLQQDWGPLSGYKWLQHGSSAIGLLILAVYALLWVRRRQVVHRRRSLPVWARWAWYLSLPVFLISGWLWGLAVLGPLTDEFTLQHLAYRVLPPASGLWGGMTVLLCVAIVIWPGRRAD
ncbi:DUF4184 family protein [Microbacterium sp. MAHUQ-60]|uniref:DUF4184 family protein n=1 Tax=unclassified Microbacterium TaxID=2609290 RepID=UPI003606A560